MSEGISYTNRDDGSIMVDTLGMEATLLDVCGPLADSIQIDNNVGIYSGDTILIVDIFGQSRTEPLVRDAKGF
jgi:hypothetical protein